MANEARRERERNVREGEMISAAEKVFGRKGFRDASMDEIATEAQFTKRTLYQYFENKEELFFAAALKSFRRLYFYLVGEPESAQSGLQKLRLGGQGYYRFSQECPGAMRLIGEIGQVKKSVGEGSQRLKELMQFDNELFRWVARVIEEGKADGSIRNDLDSVKATFSIIFMMTGFFNQLALTGGTFLKHFSLEPQQFSEYSMNLMFDSIRNQASNPDAGGAP